MKLLKLLSRMIVLCLIFSVSYADTLQLSEARERRAKSILLRNLAHFVTWPGQSEAEDTARICLLGQDNLGDILDKSIQQCPAAKDTLTVKRFQMLDDETQNCDILFINTSEQGRLADILAAVGTRPVLTVSDIPYFALKGGMIEFLEKGARFRRRINLDPVEQAGLQLGEKLLKRSEIVRTREIEQAKAARRKAYQHIQSNKQVIEADEVPEGMTVVKTPFGDRLIKK